ncbi:MAG: hypothetical protein AAFU77_17735 [Myxococcota bacterium]
MSKDYGHMSDFALNFYKQGFAEGFRLGFEEGRELGRVAGRADAVLVVFRAGGLCVTRGVEERVLGCRELEQLGRWLTNAVSVETAEQVFDE